MSGVPEGLIELEVRGTALRLLALPPGAGVPSMEQRLAMADRIIEVSPRLPRFVGSFLDGIRRKDPGADVPGDAGSDVVGHTTTQEQQAMSTKKAAKKSTKKAATKLAKPTASQPGGRISPDLATKMKVVGDGAIAQASKMLQEKAEKEAEKKKEAEKRAADKKPGAAKKPGGPAKKDAPKADGKKRGGIGQLARELLKARKSTEEVIEGVKKQFPDAKISPASVAWYRNQMREDGSLPKG